MRALNPNNWSRKQTVGVFATLLTALFGRCLYDYRNDFAQREPSGVVAPRNYNLGNVTGINARVLEFPSTLPGAVRVDKFLTPDAEYCLVHIRQMHKTGDAEQNQKYRDGIVGVQKDIYQILEQLASAGFHNVYTEGVTSGAGEALVGTVSDMRRSLDRAREIEVAMLESDLSYKKSQLEYFRKPGRINWDDNPDSEKKRIISLEAEIATTERELVARKNAPRFTDDEYMNGAAELLAREGKLRIRAAETLEGNYFASMINPTMNRKKIDELVLENREDILLHALVADEQDLGIVVYGGAHAWGGSRSFGSAYGRGSIKDNIAEWNAKYPVQKFSLIEITPTSLK